MKRAKGKSLILSDVASFENDMEYFEDGKSCLGVFAIISDLDLNPSKKYKQYKSTKEMEQVYNTMKGDLESYKTYLRNNNKMKGFYFIVFLAFRIRLRILRKLKDQNLVGKKSVYR